MNTWHEYLSTPIDCHYISRGRREEFVINDTFKETLSTVELLSFDAIWDYPEDEIIKRKNNRSVSRITLLHSLPKDRNENRPTSFFLKRYLEPLGLTDTLPLLNQSAKQRGEGLGEFWSYCDFRDNELATATPVAGGIQRLGRTLRSFLITIDFSPLYALEDVILRQPERLSSTVKQKKRKNILTAIAGYARRMHKSGMNQKDFNANHILIDDIEHPEPAIALFDLQHVDRKIANRFRWPVKALAELNVSLPDSVFSEKDRAFLFHCYKDRDHLNSFDKIQYNWMHRKTERIRRHTKKHNLAPKSNSMADWL